MTHPAYGVLRPVTETASVLLCHNPGPLTLEGTNTWVLRGPGSDDAVVIDPGPDDDAHLARLAELGPIPLVLISHRHGITPTASTRSSRPRARRSVRWAADFSAAWAAR